MQPGLSGFRTVQFLFDTAANWATSTRPLAANQFAIITDDNTRFKRGEGLASLQSGAKTFSQLPYYNRADAIFAINRTPAAINATATATAAQLATGAIKSTSPAATSITLPTATLLAALLGAAQGSTFDFVIDNSGGANIVTVVLGANTTALAVITGGNTLTVAAGSIGIFRVYFSSPTAMFIGRVA